MSRDRNPCIVNLDEASRGRSAGEVLGELPWAGRHDAPPDPKKLSALEFLNRLAAADRSGQ